MELLSNSVNSAIYTPLPSLLGAFHDLRFFAPPSHLEIPALVKYWMILAHFDIHSCEPLSCPWWFSFAADTPWSWWDCTFSAPRRWTSASRWQLGYIVCSLWIVILQVNFSFLVVIPPFYLNRSCELSCGAPDADPGGVVRAISLLSASNLSGNLIWRAGFGWLLLRNS